MIPSAAIGLAPNTATLVNIQTIMWVNAPATQVLPQVQILGRAVRITITLDHVDWTFGDGSGATERGAIKAYDKVNAPCKTRQCPGYFGHEYAHRGAVTVGATAQWTARFTVDGGGTVTIPGTIGGPAAAAALAVKQARAVLVPNPEEH